MLRVVAAVYGVVAYLIGVIGLTSIIAVLAGIMPWGFLITTPGSSSSSTLATMPAILAVAWNLLLVSAWSLIHTVMARPKFKRFLTQFIPEPLERSTYVLVAGVTSVLLTGYWQTIEGVVWQLGQSFWVTLLWSVFVFGWVFLLAATFAINHFDLFGLRQIYFHFKNLPRPPLNFVKRAMYKYIRHPIQTGVLIGIWATPVMTYTQIGLSVGFTVYIFVGLWFEERDLISLHGDEYRAYRNEAGKLFPKWST